MVLGENKINIAAMNFGRTSKGGDSIIVLNIDTQISQPVLEKIKTSAHITDAKLVKYGGAPHAGERPWPVLTRGEGA